MVRKRLREGMSTEVPPGPPPRPKDRRERSERRIWLTVVSRGGRSLDMWVREPESNGIEVRLPWSDKPYNWAIGEGEGAYDITFDEEHQVRRLTVYEGLPLAPIYIHKGNWKAVADMAAEVQTYINNVALEKAAALKETEQGFPSWGYAMLIMAILTSAVAIVSMVLG